MACIRDPQRPPDSTPHGYRQRTRCPAAPRHGPPPDRGHDRSSPGPAHRVPVPMTVSRNIAARPHSRLPGSAEAAVDARVVRDRTRSSRAQVDKVTGPYKEARHSHSNYRSSRSCRSASTESRRLGVGCRGGPAVPDEVEQRASRPPTYGSDAIGARGAGVMTRSRRRKRSAVPRFLALAAASAPQAGPARGAPRTRELSGKDRVAYDHHRSRTPGVTRRQPGAGRPAMGRTGRLLRSAGRQCATG